MVTRLNVIWHIGDAFDSQETVGTVVTRFTVIGLLAQ
jgi:hypothetical protein